MNEIIHVSQLFSIGSFYLPTYGLLVATGFLCGMSLAQRQARRSGLNPETVGNLAIYAALVGLLGAKLLMFVMDFSYYARNPERIFSLETLLSAGVYYGGFLLALAFCWWYLKRQNMPFLATADVLSRACAGARNRQARLLRGGLLLGYALRFALGRGLHESGSARLHRGALERGIAPAQLYESGATFAVAAALVYAASKPHRQGNILAWYLVRYSIARLAVEFVRNHEQALPFGGPFSWTQWIAIGLLVVGCILLWKTAGKPAKEKVR